MIQSGSKEIASQASAILATSSVRELRQLHVDESDEKLELSGSVRSFYHKQLALETVRTVAQGRQLINRVEVDD